jgi:hypothetical protein
MLPPPNSVVVLLAVLNALLNLALLNRFVGLFLKGIQIYKG